MSAHGLMGSVARTVCLVHDNLRVLPVIVSKISLEMVNSSRLAWMSRSSHPFPTTPYHRRRVYAWRTCLGKYSLVFGAFAFTAAVFKFECRFGVSYSTASTGFSGAFNRCNSIQGGVLRFRHLQVICTWSRAVEKCESGPECLPTYSDPVMIMTDANRPGSIHSDLDLVSSITVLHIEWKS
jgi:hypothetical protein